MQGTGELPGAHLSGAGAPSPAGTVVTLQSVVPPVSLRAGAPLWYALKVVWTLHQALAAVPGETELLFLVSSKSAGVRTITDRAGGQTLSQRSLSSGTRYVLLVNTDLAPG